MCKLHYKHKEGEHFCFISTLKADTPGLARFIYFDFETSQDEVVGQNKYGDIQEHKVLFVAAQKTSSACQEGWDPQATCGYCRGVHQKTFSGPNSLKEFLDWALDFDLHEGCTLVAHYGKGFDSIFIMKHMLAQGICLDMLNDGLKLNQLVLNKRVSHNFILSEWSACFE